MALFTHTPQEVAQSPGVEPAARSPRRLIVAEIVSDLALPGAFIEVPGLGVGDVPPVAERDMATFVRYGGVGFSTPGSESYPSRLWPLLLPAHHPVIQLFTRYSSSLHNVHPQRGRFLAYNAFNPDRSGVKGELRIDSVTPGDGLTQTYRIGVGVVSRIPFPASDNPPPLLPPDTVVL